LKIGTVEDVRSLNNIYSSNGQRELEFANFAACISVYSTKLLELTDRTFRKLLEFKDLLIIEG